MKKYLLGFAAVVFSIGFNAFTIKKHSLTSSTDLIFFATSTCANVGDPTKYDAAGTSLYSCPSTTKIIACKLLSVDDRYTHVNALGHIVLNTTTDNPQDEPLLFIIPVQTIQSYCKIDFLIKSDVGAGTVHFATEGTDFTNGDIGE